jgi:hypothetical protein
MIHAHDSLWEFFPACERVHIADGKLKSLVLGRRNFGLLIVCPFASCSCKSIKANSHAMPQPRPCLSPDMSCRQGFRLCLYYLIYTVRLCSIHTCHPRAAPLPCYERSILKATSQSLESSVGFFNTWNCVGKPRRENMAPIRRGL